MPRRVQGPPAAPRLRRAVAVAAAAAFAVAPAASAQEQPYRHNDAAGFRDVLPPGTDGTATGPELATFLATGVAPAHSRDQLGMYEDLVYAAPDVRLGDLDRFYKDASFGVRPEDVARRYSPRDDVVILRDRAHGVPHVYGKSRDGAMFGLGYVAAEDRLFLMDVLRNIGRAQLSSFVGGAAGNRGIDRDQWEVAPYTEEDLQSQVDAFDDLYGPAGAQIQRDARNYVAGVNRRIAELRMNPSQLPGEYAAISRPRGPEPWKETDIIATAALVGGIFGKGGGGEVGDAVLLQAFRERFGARRGERLWRRFGGFEDPEAAVTAKGRRFPYGAFPRRRRGLAMPDPGSVRPHDLVRDETGSADERAGRSTPGVLDGLRAGRGMSNALLISARQSASGRPLAVFGPQTGYFAPQLLMEQDVHAPAGEAGPGIDARGAAFAGTNLYVQLGRGRDYAWSATAAGQDIIDTYALELCEPDGSAPTLRSAHYVFRGRCVAMEELRRRNCWQPTAADQTPAGCETLVALRTHLGLVRSRGTVRGRPVAFAELRATYFHEVDSALGFMDFNDPERMRGPRDFRRAAHKILYTFNWFFVDDRDIAYYNSGANPIRPRGVDMHLPVHGRPRYEWRGFDPVRRLATVSPPRRHPQAVNQPFLSNWNNRQAAGYRAAGFGGYTSVHRVDMLDRRARAGIRGSRRMSLVDLVNQVEDAGTVDLRGQEVLPHVLRIVRRPPRGTRRPVLAALSELRAWVRSGAHRRDRNRDGRYDDHEAIRIMDAWWEPMLRAIFEPRLGKKLFAAVRRAQQFDDHNRDDHVGSAFQSGWYGYVDKDLRAVLGRRVRGGLGPRFCGGGDRRRCRRVLLESLERALAVPVGELYEDPQCPDEKFPDLQMCDEAVRHSPTGGVSHPLIHWINRPTYQQAVEVGGAVPGGR